MSLNLSLSDVSSWLDSGCTFLAGRPQKGCCGLPAVPWQAVPHSNLFCRWGRYLWWLEMAPARFLRCEVHFSSLQWKCTLWKNTLRPRKPYDSHKTFFTSSILADVFWFNYCYGCQIHYYFYNYCLASSVWEISSYLLHIHSFIHLYYIDSGIPVLFSVSPDAQPAPALARGSPSKLAPGFDTTLPSLSTS